jgi:hypothetical protein
LVFSGGSGGSFEGDLVAEGFEVLDVVALGAFGAEPVRFATPRGRGRTGNRYLASVLGEAAISASRTDTFLGERYRRIARRRGK